MSEHSLRSFINIFASTFNKNVPVSNVSIRYSPTYFSVTLLWKSSFVHSPHIIPKNGEYHCKDSLRLYFKQNWGNPKKMLNRTKLKKKKNNKNDFQI